jgi:hypothetical protein
MVLPDLPWSALILTLVMAGEGAAVVDPRVRCQADKNKHAGTYLACRMKVIAESLRAAETPDFSRCDARLAEAFRKAEERAAGACPTQGDVGALRRALERCTTEASTALETSPDTPPPRCLGSGFLVGGRCWFVGGPGESCDQRCASQALLYDGATESFSGSGGSLANCQKLVNGYLAIVQPGLFAGAGDAACADLGLDGLGCAWLSVGFTALPVRCTTPPTTSAAAHPDAARFCACTTP